LLTSWLAVTSILFGAFSRALAEGPAEPSATALIEALVTRREPVGGPFDLIDHTGRRRTDADFRGKLVVIYFGYTHCPDVCPTTLSDIAQALDQLGPVASQIQPLFVTVDPERDDPATMRDYTQAFGTRILGLTGSPAQIAAIAKAYHVYYAKHPEGAGYSMDHSAIVYVMRPDGTPAGFLTPDIGAPAIADKLKAIVAKG